MSVSAYGPPPEPDAWGPALTGHPVLVEVGDDELRQKGGELAVVPASSIAFCTHLMFLYMGSCCSDIIFYLTFDLI